jgi:hypothetical protein
MAVARAGVTMATVKSCAGRQGRRGGRGGQEGRAGEGRRGGRGGGEGTGVRRRDWGQNIHATLVHSTRW